MNGGSGLNEPTPSVHSSSAAHGRGQKYLLCIEEPMDGMATWCDLHVPLVPGEDRVLSRLHLKKSLVPQASMLARPDRPGRTACLLTVADQVFRGCAMLI